jgi:hypothetical protein
MNTELVPEGKWSTFTQFSDVLPRDGQATGPWWNPLCDPNIKAAAVYRQKPLTWWQRILRRLGLGRFVKRESFRMTEEQIAEVARSMAKL